MFIRASLLTVILLAVLTSGVKAQGTKEGITYKTERALPYYSKSSMRGDEYIQKMCVFDFYYPTNIESYPTIIWFHGGGLTGGNRSIPEYLKNRGFAVIGADYRLTPRVKGIECIKDAAAVTAWAFKHIEDYGGDENLIFVSGMSAGGYLTYMVGLDRTYLDFHKVDANKIAGLISFSGHTITHFSIRKERGIAAHQPIIEEMAPLYHIRADAPPLLIITGDRELEMFGRYEESAYMMRMMKVVGHQKTRIYELDGNNHQQMMYPAFPLLVREVNTLTKMLNSEK